MTSFRQTTEMPRSFDSLALAQDDRGRVLLSSKKRCHPERSEAESKDLRLSFAQAVRFVRRSFGSLALAQDDRGFGSVES